MSLTEEMNEFLSEGVVPGQEKRPLLEPVNPFEPKVSVFLPPTVAQRRSLPWDQQRTQQAEQRFHAAIGLNETTQTSSIMQHIKIDRWWREEGQFIPDDVLRQIGIDAPVYSERYDTLQESLARDKRDRVKIVKEAFGLGPREFHDPVVSPLEAGSPPELIDPDQPEDEYVKVAGEEVLPHLRDTDLLAVVEVMQNNRLEFDEALVVAAEDEIDIRRIIRENLMPEMAERPLTVLLGTDFYDKLLLRFPSYLAREGIDSAAISGPAQVILEGLGLGKNRDRYLALKGAERLRNMVLAEDPRLLTAIGLETGNILATIVHFAMLPDPS